MVDSENAALRLRSPTQTDLERLPPGLIPEPACVEVRRLAVVVNEFCLLKPELSIGPLIRSRYGSA
jgi:hypothetical protein